MNWLPSPRDFRQSLRTALAVTDPLERLETLAALAQHQLGFLETIQLDNALGKTAATANAPFVQIRLALLSSCTIDHLLPAIRIAGLRRRLLIEVYTGSFGQYRQELLDPASALHGFRPDIILFSLTARDAIAGVPLGATTDEADQAMARASAEVQQLWRTARETFKAPVIQQSFLDVSEPLFGSYDRLVSGTPTRLITHLNDLLTDAAAREQVLWLDIARASARDGLDTWFDAARWLQGKIEIAPQSAARYGDLVARLIAAHRGQSKKCLALDLDNTLWGGVIGDDGIEGIRLGEGSAVGEAHAGLQRYARQLKDRGVILAVCSKNDLATAEAAFRDHPEMVLRRSDIAAFVANWNDKAENLRAIAEQLNIGLDSLVFVDDNPAERARVRESLPMVAVPELPADAAHYVRCIADAGYFEAVSFTEEDRHRAGQYAANAEREALREGSQSMDDFLRGLDMAVMFGPVATVDLARAAQLINKTNQFNTTTRRYSAEELSGLAAAPEDMTFQFRLLDRFGDNGLVSVMLLRPIPGEPDVLDIDSWVMSCRVFGRQLEFEAMNIAVEAAKNRGIRAFRADYIPTKKNGVIGRLYESLGFSCLPQPLTADGASRWSLNLAEYHTRPTFIIRREP